MKKQRINEKKCSPLVEACKKLLTEESVKPQNAAATKEKLKEIFDDPQYQNETYLEFDLSGNSEKYNKGFLGVVISVLEKNPRIKSITISGLNASEDVYKLVSQKLVHCSAIDSLSFLECFIPKEGFGHLTQYVLTYNKGLKALSFEGTPIGENLDMLILALRSLPNLEHLNLFECGLNDAQTRKILSALCEHPTLRTLNIAGNVIEKLKTKKQLGKTLSSLPRLAEVVLPTYADDFMFDENVVELVYLNNKNLSVVYPSESFSEKQWATCLYRISVTDNISILPRQVICHVYQLPHLYDQPSMRSEFKQETEKNEDKVLVSPAFYNVTKNLKAEYLTTRPNQKDKEATQTTLDRAFLYEVELKITPTLSTGGKTYQVYLDISRLLHRYNGKLTSKIEKAKFQQLKQYLIKNKELFEQLKLSKQRESQPRFSTDSSESLSSFEETKPAKVSKKYNAKVGVKPTTDFFKDGEEKTGKKQVKHKRKRDTIDKEERVRRLKAASNADGFDDEELMEKEFGGPN